MVYEQSGIITYYETYGDPKSPALLLLHGLGADNTMWKEQIEPLSGNGFFLIIPDLLAHGKSSKMSALTLDDWSFQINSLLDHQGIEKFSLIGVSMGGVIAQHYAAQNSARLEKLIISDTFSDLSSVLEKIMGISQVIALPLFKFMGKKVFAKLMASAYPQEFAEKARKYLYDVSLKGDFDQLLLARKAINRIRVLDQLPRVSFPSLVLVGDQFGQRFIDINKKIAEHLPNSHFHVISNSMDPSCLVQPEEFNRIILDFLGEK